MRYIFNQFKSRRIRLEFNRSRLRNTHDPWWNPAVEEQASDRAHRIGQTRPVTIYRLIAQNTIEEKIVALHQHKRDLADKLLSGNEAVTKLSVDDMLSLLKETF